METQQVDEKYIKAIKSRGYYFSALSKDLCQKYNIPIDVFDDIRRLTINKRHRDQQALCIRITNALNDGTYINGKNPLRQRTLSFLLRCAPKIFSEISQITKYDWDYEGEERKMPPIEQRNLYIDYLKKYK